MTASTELGIAQRSRRGRSKEPSQGSCLIDARWAAVVVVLATLAPACRNRPPAAGAPSASPAAAAATPPRPAPRFRRIDVHTHIAPDGIERAVRLMDQWGIDGMVNLSGMHPGPPNHALERQLAAAQEAHGRIAVFTTPDFRLVVRRADYGAAMADQLSEARRLGAIGLKITKGLGLGYRAHDGVHLLAVDDHGLDALFERAGELGMPVAIHCGDPKAFWQPATPQNERWDELQAHPEWSFADAGVPSWQELYDGFDRLIGRHPKTTFIGVHFGNDPEDPDTVARMLDKHPNLVIDTAARVPEIGRHPQEKMRRFFTKYQDRVLFGTDTGIGAEQDDMMYGSTGAAPPTHADEVRFFTETWRYFETPDRQIESPTPIQGRWKIDGVGLPDDVLRKIYWDNAVRILRWQPTR